MDGDLQFDSYAETQLAAKQITLAVMKLFAGWGGILPDGTTIQFTEVVMHKNAPYEVGGTGYLYHSVLRMKAMYTEGS